MSKQYFNCIHCGMKPYPVCPECNGYWSGSCIPNRGTCNVCGYKPTDEQMSLIATTVMGYNEQQKAKEGDTTKTTLEEDALARYKKLHSHLLGCLSTADGEDVLNLMQALNLAKEEVDKSVK